MVVLFWLSALFIIYVYFGYPLLVWLRKKQPTKLICSEPFPPVSVVMVVHNEENYIERKLNNLLGQEPKKIISELIVVSDSSNDKTESMVRKFQKKHNHIKLIVLDHKSGKAAGLNAGIKNTKHEIIVFCDARQIFNQDSVRHLIEHFKDPDIGAVAGELRFSIKSDDFGDNIEQSIGLYWKYETWIRKNESISFSMLGAPGAIYSARKSLIAELPKMLILDDVWIPIHVVMSGKRVRYEPEAVAWDQAEKNSANELRRKVRTLAGNYQIIAKDPYIISPVHNKLWWMFVSHKVFRLFVPYALVICLLSSALIGGSLFITLFFIQSAFYLFGLLGWLLEMAKYKKACKICSVAYMFIMMNIAAIMGLYYFLLQKEKKLWTTKK